MHVLVVEDEPFIGLDLILIAETLGFEVSGPAENSSSALAMAAENPPDIALVDVNLADGRTGPLVASELTAVFGTAIIAATANPDGIFEGEDGVEAVLVKPFAQDAVAATLLRLAARRSD